jgi:hypothetical protein
MTGVDLPETVEGNSLLDAIETYIRRFIVLSESQARAITLWVVHTHVLEAADCTPYLAITSAEKQSGKTRLLEVLETLVAKLCRGCGKTIEGDSRHCKKCDLQIATERLVEVARAGRIAGHTPEAIAKEALTQRRHAQARSAWTPASQPAWLSEQVYAEKIQPLLAGISSSVIAKRIGVSRWYAGRIRQGYRPHPRHWEALAELTGIAPGN